MPVRRVLQPTHFLFEFPAELKRMPIVTCGPSSRLAVPLWRADGLHVLTLEGRPLWV
jgi:hypothetical protein